MAFTSGTSRGTILTQLLGQQIKANVAERVAAVDDRHLQVPLKALLYRDPCIDEPRQGNQPGAHGVAYSLPRK